MTSSLGALRALSEAATAGPWRVVPENWEFHAHIEAADGTHIGAGAPDTDLALVVRLVNDLRTRLEGGK